MLARLFRRHSMLAGLFRRHPRTRALSAFSDGTLDATAAGRVAAHLERCSRCQAELRLLREADAALRDVPVPRMPDGLLERVLARRAANIRTIAPAAPGPAPDARVRLAAGLAPVLKGLVAIVTLAAAALLIPLAMTSRPASAGASELHFAYEEAGSSGSALVIPVVYRPAAGGAEFDGARVRAAAWSGVPDGDPARPGAEAVGVLSSSGDRLEGEIELPPGTVFAAVAVEALDGARLDVNGGQLWFYRERRADGTPTLRARLAELAVMRAWSESGLIRPAEVHRIASRVAEADPSNIRAWWLRANYRDRAGLDAATRDSLERQDGERLAAFMSLARAGELGVEELLDLEQYAEYLEQGGVATEGALAETRALLERAAPDHPLVVQRRMMALFPLLRDDPSALLERLEGMWQESRAPMPDIFDAARSMAELAGDGDALVRWSRRHYEAEPESRDGIARRLAGHAQPSVTAVGIELVRERLAHYESLGEADRPVYETVDGFEAWRQRQLARLDAALGTALIARGERANGLAILEAALNGPIWNPAAARAFVAARASEAGAAYDPALERAGALLHADPLVAPSAELQGEFSRETIRRAERELIDMLRRPRLRGRVADGLSFRSRVGGVVPVDDGRTTLIALWQAIPAGEHEEAARLVARTERLESEGVRVLLASTEERLLGEGVELAERAGARPVVDENGAATESFGGWHLRQYVVVHAGEYSVHFDLDEAARLAVLLARE